MSGQVKSHRASLIVPASALSDNASLRKKVHTIAGAGTALLIGSSTSLSVLAAEPLGQAGFQQFLTCIALSGLDAHQRAPITVLPVLRHGEDGRLQEGLQKVGCPYTGFVLLLALCTPGNLRGGNLV